jgi:hypothetical protein
MQNRQSALVLKYRGNKYKFDLGAIGRTLAF